MTHERDSEIPTTHQPLETRDVGGRALKFTMVESESPEAVMERDNVKGDVTGTRSMVEVVLGKETFGRSSGRKAPRYSGPQTPFQPKN